VNNKNIFKKTLAAAAIVAGLSAIQVAEAANWLMLQGTERPGAAPRAKVWGFLQPEYQSTDGTDIQAGPWAGQKAIFNQVRPDLDTDSDLNVLRARFGIRGVSMPLDSNVNYFFLAETGNNGVTRHGNSGTAGMRMTDASVTLNNIKGARIRIGQFKAPLGDEALQAIHVMDYINFTGIGNGLMMERFFDGDGSDTNVVPNPAFNPALPPGPTNSPVIVTNINNDPNLTNSGVGAFRDVGIQVFDTFKMGNIEHSYAVMIGNGNGVNRGDNDSNKDTYVYYSAEQVYGGKGPKRQGLKAYVWSVDGKRTLTNTDAGAGEYDRTRTGVGVTYRKGKQRAAFEYITAEGMIFTGSDGAAVPGATAVNGNAISSFNVATTGEADGYYIHYGYAITPKVELDARYDVYNRQTDNAKAERVFTTMTLGAQYWLNKKSHLTINYELRDAEAPGLPSTHNANKILDGMDDRLSIGLLTIF
jgi:hypothetical protein